MSVNRIITVSAVIVCIALSVALVVKSKRVAELEDVLIDSSIMQVSSDAVMANYVASNDLATYYELTEQVFYSLPELLAAHGISEEDPRVGKAKEWISLYFSTSKREPKSGFDGFLTQ